MSKASKQTKSSKKPSKIQHAFSLELKSRFIKYVMEEKEKDSKAFVSFIGRQFGITTASTAHEIWNDRTKLLSTIESVPTRATKGISRYSTRNMEEVEDALYDWLQDQRKLVFSRGWLRGFKNRRGIKKYVGHGESGSVNLDNCRAKLKEIQMKLANFHPSNIYNCDETSLFLKGMSNKTLADGPIHGRKVIREARVSILLCSNDTGQDKRKLFVLSKHKPKGLTAETLSRIDYDTTGSGYMTQVLFHGWLKVLDEDMRAQSRKIALLIDSASGHGRIEEIELTNIAIIRLPPSTTSETQPMDAGIIASFKVLYSKEMLEVVAHARVQAKSPVATVSNGKLWSCLVDAWEKVTPDCIHNGFVYVPSMPPQHNDYLRTLGVETKMDQTRKLQDELIKKYTEISDVISKQSDFAVLNFINMCSSEGPSEAIYALAMRTIAKERYKGVFRQSNEIEFIDEDELEKLDDLDPDFEFHQPSASEGWVPSIALRFRVVEYHSYDAYSSPDTSPFKKQPPLIFREIQDLLNNVTEDVLEDGDETLQRGLQGLYESIEIFAERRQLQKMLQEELNKK